MIIVRLLENIHLCQRPTAMTLKTDSSNIISEGNFYKFEKNLPTIEREIVAKLLNIATKSWTDVMIFQKLKGDL